MNNPDYWTRRAIENLQTALSQGDSMEVDRLMKQALTLVLMAVAHGEEGS